MKKVLCLFLALTLMLFLAAGCSPKNPSASTSPSESSSPSAEPGSGDGSSKGSYVYKPIDWGKHEVTDVGQDVLKFDMVSKSKQLPLTDERVSFTAWWPIQAGFATHYDNYAKYPNMVEMENRTNVHIDYVQPTATDVANSFPLMIASQDYTDMIYYADLYAGGGDKAIQDGVYIKLNDLIDKYAPNYSAIRNYTEDARKMTITTSGNIWGFYNICKEHMPGYMGLSVRQDMLDKIGYQGRPETIDDWTDVLGKLKDGVSTLKYAFALPPTGITQWSAFTSAWDVGSDWYQVDGKAKFGPAEPDFRKYVELMKSWYDKGYLRKDFYGVNPANYNMDVCSKEYGAGDCAATDGANMFGTILYQFGSSADPNINVVAARQPVLNKGDETHIRFDQGVVNGRQLAITTACKNPELLTSWVDYRYTLDGYLLIYYGVEGQTFQQTGDYHINFTDLITKDKDGLAPFTALGSLYAAGILECSLSDYTNGWCFLDPRYSKEVMTWTEDKYDHNFPNISFLNADDASEYASIYSDIDTYVKETIPKFIIGSMSMNEYDNFTKKLHSMNVDRCIELKQVVLDDYNKR